ISRRQSTCGKGAASGKPLRKSKRARRPKTLGRGTSFQILRGESASGADRGGRRCVAPPARGGAWLLTKVPAPTREVTNPSPASRSYATVTVVRDTLRLRASSRVGGRRSPERSRPPT